jgi:hypothetical protein
VQREIVSRLLGAGGFSDHNDVRASAQKQPQRVPQQRLVFGKMA